VLHRSSPQCACAHPHCHPLSHPAAPDRSPAHCLAVSSVFKLFLCMFARSVIGTICAMLMQSIIILLHSRSVQTGCASPPPWSSRREQQPPHRISGPGSLIWLARRLSSFSQYGRWMRMLTFRRAASFRTSGVINSLPACQNHHPSAGALVLLHHHLRQAVACASSATCRSRTPASITFAAPSVNFAILLLPPYCTLQQVNTRSAHKRIFSSAQQLA